MTKIFNINNKFQAVNFRTKELLDLEKLKKLKGLVCGGNTREKTIRSPFSPVLLKPIEMG